MNSNSNSFRNLTASGDPVISLLLSHKALYLSHIHTHARTHTFVCRRSQTHQTRKHIHLLFISAEGGNNAADIRTIHQDIHRCLWKKGMHVNTHTHTPADTHTRRCSFTKAVKQNISHEPKPLII